MTLNNPTSKHPKTYGQNQTFKLNEGQAGSGNDQRN